MSLPVLFSFDGATVRIVLVEGEPWWFASEVCSAIGLADTNKALLNLDLDEKREHEKYSGSGRKPILINESGLYSLILRSRKSEAKRFKKWITAQVLPSLRRHGSYVMPQTEQAPESCTRAPMAAHVEADQIVSAGRVFRALFGTARSMGMARRLAATRANQAAARTTGVDLAAELGASQWLDSPDLPAPQRKRYELQQQIRDHLVAHDWPHAFSTQQLIEALGLPSDKGTQMGVGHCLQLIGYTRKRLPAKTPSGIRPWGYVLECAPAAGLATL